MLTRTLFGRYRILGLVGALSVMLAAQPSVAQSHAQNGATAGGLAGAVIGGIIGHQNDEVPEGALIGGAVGAIAGGMLGKAHDNELERQRYYQQQAYYQQQQQAYAQQQAAARTGVTLNDIISMNRNGLSEPLIISQLQTKGVARRLEVSEIIALHQQGVSDNLITAMQQAPLASQLSASAGQASITPPPIVVPQPGGVIVREPLIYSEPAVVVERIYRPRPSYHYYHRHYHPNYRGASIRIGF